MKDKTPVTDFIATESLSIVDPAGKPRTMLDADAASFSEHLSIVDKTGKARIIFDVTGAEPAFALMGGKGSSILIGFDEKTSSPFMSVSDTSKCLRYHFAVDPTDDSASVTIHGRKQESVISLRPSDDSGLPVVAVSSPDGRSGLMIKSDGSGFHIAIFGADGKGAATIGAMNGETRVATYDENGKAVWSSDGKGISQQ